jgi:transcriptional regulator with XRE-family HTH domain
MPKRIKLKVNISASVQFLGIDLVRAREVAGLTEQELADRVGFWTQQSISWLENSEATHTITLEQLKAINRALNLQT